MPEFFTKPSWARFSTIWGVLSSVAIVVYGVASFGIPARATDVQLLTSNFIKMQTIIHGTLPRLNRLELGRALSDQRAEDIQADIQELKDNFKSFADEQRAGTKQIIDALRRR